MAKNLVCTRRYVQKFYQMHVQLQAVGLRIQTLRSNQQMADAMHGATRVRHSCYLLSSLPSNSPSLGLAPHSRTTPMSMINLDATSMKRMNCGLNLPQIQRIMNDFEREIAVASYHAPIMPIVELLLLCLRLCGTSGPG